ncbi:MAG TPA: hypothetical protein VF970_11910 [Gemmatimonadales bacterium]
MFPSSAFLAALLAAGLFGVPSGQESCGNWSGFYQRGADNPLSLSFRLCQLTTNRWQMEWRWANGSDRDLHFAFRIYTSDPVDCGKRPGRTLAQGEHRIKAGFQEEFTSGRRRLSEFAFTTAPMLYWCIYPVEPDPEAVP